MDLVSLKKVKYIENKFVIERDNELINSIKIRYYSRNVLYAGRKKGGENPQHSIKNISINPI